MCDARVGKTDTTRLRFLLPFQVKIFQHPLAEGAVILLSWPLRALQPAFAWQLELAAACPRAKRTRWLSSVVADFE